MPEPITKLDNRKETVMNERAQMIECIRSEMVGPFRAPFQNRHWQHLRIVITRT